MINILNKSRDHYSEVKLKVYWESQTEKPILNIHLFACNSVQNVSKQSSITHCKFPLRNVQSIDKCFKSWKT